MGLDDIEEFDSPPHVRPIVNGNLLIPAGKMKGSSCDGGVGVNENSCDSRQRPPVDLGDLFSDLTLSSTAPSTVVGNNKSGKDGVFGDQCGFDTHQQQKKQEKKISSGFNDPLDSFFTSPSPAASLKQGIPLVDESVGDDLFDLSKPAERTKHSDERSFLEAFENNSRGGHGVAREGPSLADLSKGSSDNLVKARLLKMMNYYDVLGVARNATQDQIRQQYKKKALELHPDRVGCNQTPEEAELFKVMTKAHEVLSDEEERAKYDRELWGVGSTGNFEDHWLFHLRPQ